MVKNVVLKEKVPLLVITDLEQKPPDNKEENGENGDIGCTLLMHKHCTNKAKFRIVAPDLDVILFACPKCAAEVKLSEWNEDNVFAVKTLCMQE